jgi:hypothetical protein
MTHGREPLKRSLTRQYVLLACVPLLMVVVLWSLVAIPQAVRDIEEENQRTALLVRSQVELLIAAPREAAYRAATHVTPNAPESVIRAALSEALDEAPSLESVELLDKHGIVAIAEVRPGTGIGPRDWEGLDLSRRPFYPRARLATAPVWSDTFLSPLTGRVTAVVSAPADGRIVVADLSLEKMSRQINLPGNPGDVAVIVFDGLGRVIVHPQQELASWQESLTGMKMVRDALAGYSGPGEIELGGRRWLATVAPAATTGWYVLVRCWWCSASSSRSRCGSPSGRRGATSSSWTPRPTSSTTSRHRPTWTSAARRSGRCGCSCGGCSIAARSRSARRAMRRPSCRRCSTPRPRSRSSRSTRTTSCGCSTAAPRRCSATARRRCSAGRARSRCTTPASSRGAARS